MILVDSIGTIIFNFIFVYVHNHVFPLMFKQVSDTASQETFSPGLKSSSPG